MKSVVYNIQRMSVHDGPGIRTIVFLKGCPLDCKWCHNPESKNIKPILLFDINKCIGCKKCSIVCDLHKFDKDYNHLNPNYFLHHKILEMYKNDYEIADINGIADDFTNDSKYSRLNKFKFGFNPTITEYIGELDLIISEWKFKIVEKNNLLSNEFTKKKDTTNIK